MSPAELFDSFACRLEDIKEELQQTLTDIGAVAMMLHEEAEEAQPAEFRPQGFACVVERQPEGVTLVVRMRHANIALPLPADRARELASLLLVQSEGEREL